MNYFQPLVPSFIAAFISMILVPLIIRLAHRKGWFDDPNDPRKIHTGKIPRLGGPAMFLSFIAALCVIEAMSGGRDWTTLAMIAGGGLAMHLVGLLDDFRSLRARFKFIVQIMAAIVVVAAGFSFDRLYLPFLAEPVELGLVGSVVTVLWIAGIANAVNMIDGMDGLAGGIGLIASIAYGAIYLSLGVPFMAAVSFALTGAIIGFLFFNLPPARIFMGDSGSLFLGFVLAVIPLVGATENPAALGVLPSATILAIPIFDVFAAILRRRRRRVHIMSPDREHLHHKLMDFGLDTRQILALVYSVCIALGAVAASSGVIGELPAFFALASALVALALGFLFLHFAKERAKEVAH